MRNRSQEREEKLEVVNGLIAELKDWKKRKPYQDELKKQYKLSSVCALVLLAGVGGLSWLFFDIDNYQRSEINNAQNNARNEMKSAERECPVLGSPPYTDCDFAMAAIYRANCTLETVTQWMHGCYAEEYGLSASTTFVEGGPAIFAEIMIPLIALASLLLIWNTHTKTIKNMSLGMGGPASEEFLERMNAIPGISLTGTSTIGEVEIALNKARDSLVSVVGNGMFSSSVAELEMTVENDLEGAPGDTLEDILEASQALRRV